MRIAILDDDPAQAGCVAAPLREAGFSCDLFTSVRPFLNRMHNQVYDLVTLDWIMPDMSGIEALRVLRESDYHDTPVIMVSACSSDLEMAQGLNAGADDFVPKPVSPQLLLARVGALLRRKLKTEDSRSAPFVLGPYQFDPVTASVRLHGQPVTLTNREFGLARTLFAHPHRVFSRQYLTERLWGRNPDIPSRTLDTHVARIRAKLQIRPENGVRLVTLYGCGYRLEQVSDCAWPPLEDIRRAG